MLVRRHHVFLALLALLCPPGPVSAQTTSEKLLPSQVLRDLLDRHGDNGTISVPQLRALLALLSQPQGEGGAAEGGDLHTQAATTTASPSLNGSKVRNGLNDVELPRSDAFCLIMISTLKLKKDCRRTCRQENERMKHSV